MWGQYTATPTRRQSGQKALTAHLLGASILCDTPSNLSGIHAVCRDIAFPLAVKAGPALGDRSVGVRTALAPAAAGVDPCRRARPDNVSPRFLGRRFQPAFLPLSGADALSVFGAVLCLLLALGRWVAGVLRRLSLFRRSVRSADHSPHCQRAGVYGDRCGVHGDRQPALRPHGRAAGGTAAGRDAPARAFCIAGNY